ncbi:MAG: right-handed parallel beta-helix repeat-containing protein, partial [Gloeomargarita sp. DG02_1_bins_92]
MWTKGLLGGLIVLGLWAPGVQAQKQLESIRFAPSAGLRYTNQSGGTVGFTSVESFFPVWQIPGHLTYLAPIFHVFDDGNFGGNVILGHRAYDWQNQRLFGGYISWDGRGLHDNFYNQLGLGFETAIGFWNVHLNGYIPFGKSRRQTGEQVLGLASVPFRGNRLFLDAVSFFDAAMAGLDVEVGRVVPLNERGYLRPFLGGYYLTAERSENALGIRGGLQVVREVVSTGLAVQHDGLFGTQVLFTVGINLTEAAGIKRSVPQTAMTQGMLVAQAEGELPAPPVSALPLETANFIQRLAGPVSRRNSITIENQRIREDVVALAPDGQPYEVFHVRVGASGDGTAESPFGTIQPAMNAAAGAKNPLVYVRPGANTGLQPFTVPPGTQVFSSAVDYPLPVRTRLSPLREVTIPAIPGDVRPLVQGTFGTDLASGQGVVTLNSNTTLAGLNVQVIDPLAVGGTPGRRGIVAVGAENVRILSNTVNNALGEGIYLENVTGNAQILNNTVTGTRTNTGAFADFNGAIFVYNNQGTINATIRGNTVTVPAGATEVDGIEINLCRSGAPFTPCSGAAFG